MAAQGKAQLWQSYSTASLGESGRDQGMGRGWSCKVSEYSWADFSDGAMAKLLTREQSEMACSLLGGGVCEPGTTETEPVAKTLFGTKVWSPSLWGGGEEEVLP